MYTLEKIIFHYKGLFKLFTLRFGNSAAIIDKLGKLYKSEFKKS